MKIFMGNGVEFLSNMYPKVLKYKVILFFWLRDDFEDLIDDCSFACVNCKKNYKTKQSLKR